MTDEWLQQRGSDLIRQSQQPDLAEIQVERGFQDRVDRGQQRLNHVVQQMAQT